MNEEEKKIKDYLKIKKSLENDDSDEMLDEIYNKVVKENRKEE